MTTRINGSDGMVQVVDGEFARGSAWTENHAMITAETGDDAHSGMRRAMYAGTIGHMTVDTLLNTHGVPAEEVVGRATHLATAYEPPLAGRELEVFTIAAQQELLEQVNGGAAS